MALVIQCLRYLSTLQLRNRRTLYHQGYGDIICIYMISILFVIMNVDQGGHLSDFLYKYIQEFALYAHSCACGLSRLVERMLSDNRIPSSNLSHCLFDFIKAPQLLMLYTRVYK